MVIIIYFILIFILWMLGRKFGTGFHLKHASYSSFIVPALVIPIKRILKKDILSYGRKLMFLYGVTGNERLFVIHWSIKIASFLLFSAFPVIYLTLDSPGIWATIISCMMPILGFFIPDLDLMSKINQKKASIMLDYPVFCTELAVMTGAGLDITRAWKRAAEKKSRSTFYTEVNRVISKATTGMLFQDALKEFSANLAMSEIHTFVTIVNQEIKSGSGGMAVKLRDCAKRSWRLREDLAKKKGEEAVSKMVFPLAIGLAGILLILAAPAIMIMKGV